MANWTTPHFFVTPSDVTDDHIRLPGPTAHHLRAVLRARPGDPVSVADGTGARYDAQLAKMSGVHRDGGAGSQLVLRITQRHAPSPAGPGVTVVHGLPKGRKLDDVVRRLTEAGVDRIIPVHTTRSQVQLEGAKAAKAFTRWEAVGLAAAQQSRRLRLPQIDPITAWPAAFGSDDHGIVCWEEATTALPAVLAGLQAPDPDASVVIAIGPEGGLTAEEVVTSGLAPVSLGPTILRTETAALFASAIVLAWLGRLG